MERERETKQRGSLKGTALRGIRRLNESTASTCERGGDFSISSRRQLRLKLD